MFFKQYYLSCLSHASYLVADETTGDAAVVDPQRDIDLYLADATEHGFHIRYVILTHFHADFLAGHLELRERCGAQVVLGAQAQAGFDFRAVHDGDSLVLGGVRLQVMETPGHTPEGISILVHDPAHSTVHPKAVLTGDTLFIGDVGRPDLLASIGCTVDALADMLYDSIARLRELPDDVLVYPAHGAGSMCGKNLSKETVSTIGEQKRSNYAMQPLTREQFKELVTSDQPTAPRYFVYDAIKNRQEHSSLTEILQGGLVPLGLDEVLRLQASGATLLDVRTAVEFSAAHLRGSINIGLQGSFATWCGTMLDPEAELVIVAAPGAEREAATRLGRIGYDRVRGYLAGGVEAVASQPAVLATLPRVTAAELGERLATSHPPLVLDVRTVAEHERGAIAGSLHIPLPLLPERLEELRNRGPILVHCEGGYRSPIAASWMLRAGFEEVQDLVGGYRAWAGLQTSSEAPATAASSCTASGFSVAPSACAAPAAVSAKNPA